MDFLLGWFWTTLLLMPHQESAAVPSDIAALPSLEDRLALLREGTLRLLGILGARQSDGLRLLVAVALVQRQILRQGKGALRSARRQRHLARDLPRDAKRGFHQLRAGHAGGG